MTRHLARSGRRVTCFSSGEAALASRILGYLAGAWLAYVIPDGDTPPGPGIPNASMLLDLYRLPAQGDSVKLLGLAGWPLDHSLSPRMQNRVIRLLGERYLYVPFESRSIAEVIEFVRHHDVRGCAACDRKWPPLKNRSARATKGPHPNGPPSAATAGGADLVPTRSSDRDHPLLGTPQGRMESRAVRHR